MTVDQEIVSRIIADADPSGIRLPMLQSLAVKVGADNPISAAFGLAVNDRRLKSTAC